ncbi:MAG TPA: hypothetical protein VF498_00710, partial [Anaerolineales bacterium]
MENHAPAYCKLLETGQLARQVSEAYTHLSRCDLCAWDCRKDRLAGKLGVCRTGALARVAGYHPHPGEAGDFLEPILQLVHQEQRALHRFNG